MALIRKPFVPLFLGSSLTTGRLAADWVPRLDAELKDQVEAIGPYCVINAGKGSQNSAWGVTQIADIVARQPTHILMEGFAINDCVDFGGGPAISRAGHTANITTMVTAFLAGIPGVDITIQTMSPVSTAGAAIRPQLATYYADEITTAAGLGVHSLDNYTRWAAGWPGGALPDWLCNNFDGLHPRFLNGVDTYLYPYVLLWARQKMAAMWGLTNPTVPVLPAATDCDVLIIPSGAAGGDNYGGGGAGAVPLRLKATLASLLGPVVVGATVAAPSSGQPGANGNDSSIGPFTAKAPGGGGAYSNSGSGTGKDGASGGGGGVPSNPFVRLGGNDTSGRGNHGGQSSATTNQGGGGGGGCMGPGVDGAADGGQGGPGWTDDVPGDIQVVGAGGPAGSQSGARPAYLPGAGPTALGGGGQAGEGGAADGGGPGAVYVWYAAGLPAKTGGTVTTSGGFRINKFTANGTLA